MAPPSLLSGKNPCQFLQVHARKGKPGFHLHPRLPYVLCITESVLFFRSPEDPLYDPLPPGIDIPVPTGIANTPTVSIYSSHTCLVTVLTWLLLWVHLSRLGQWAQWVPQLLYSLYPALSLSGMSGCAPPGRYNSRSTHHTRTHTP